ncbi:glutathione S-transferase [Gluconobacter cerinus]|uniref:glutathione S-transferase family protein n=1 Tax=Gluconobacter TaxID=441 RepID=UPI000299641D|nr:MULTISPECIES: glutathione S-transferase [Gluconobacter]AFW03129.1 glutathione S-transferase protein [Gluconobacter oxydans H24]MBS1042300.1 glutathione S-transferase [Gluconobacter cerinus]MBS1048894.1 glutathione S-transferase [Gluconobacter cerinus]MCW2267120.1 glutathione S-transferase [Gluconobacter cerinus]
MKLYYHPLSGHAHRAHLFLSLAGLPHELKPVDLAASEQKTAKFLELNAFGEIPVLEDGGITIPDSNAILVYAARKVGPSHWLPEDTVTEAEVQRWLSVAAGKIAYGCCAARLVTVFGVHFDVAEVIQRAHDTLKVIEQALKARTWIAGTQQPTIADVALYSYIARAPEGNVDLSGYDAIAVWLQRLESLRGFVPFQKTVVGLERGDGQ